jgi:hypothetical protein
MKAKGMSMKSTIITRDRMTRFRARAPDTMGSGKEAISGRSVAALTVAALGLLCFGDWAVLAQNPVPLISQPLVPTSTSPGGPAFTLTVNGAGFVSNSVVEWNGSPRVTSYVNSSRLAAAIPASDIAGTNTAWITVSNPAPGGGVSDLAFFPIAAPRASILLRKTDYSVPTDNIQVVTADFNRDGKLDLAFADWDGSTVGVFQGNGDGTFQPWQRYWACGAVALATGDFNEDRMVDMAVAARGCHEMLILLGNGDGTFRNGQSYGVPAVPYSVCVGDFNSDGNLDVVSGNEAASSVSVFLGRGDGTFQNPVDYNLDNVSGYVTRVATADFNGDGRLDLAASTDDSSVAIFIGHGDGSFGSSSLLPTALGINRYLIAADWNGDALPDLAVPSSSGSVSVLFGRGDGSFDPFVRYETGGAVGDPWSAAAADFNGDGILDLVTSDWCPSLDKGNLSLFLGKGDSTFQTRMEYPVCPWPRALCVGDFNGDGRLDLAVGSQGHWLISVCLNYDASTPFILTHPASQVAFLGLTVNFGVTAVGIPPLTYQWLFNATNLLTGATNSTLTLANVQLSHAGQYSVVVSNALGSVVSSAATLTVMEFRDALNASGLSWALGGDAEWSPETAFTHDGVAAAQSGSIWNSEQSSLSTTVSGPGTLAFWWKVSSEESYDYLRFLLSGTERVAISGEVDWQMKSFKVPAGSQTLMWRYEKDFSVGSGLDAGWLDEVSFVPFRLSSPVWRTNGVFQFLISGAAPGNCFVHASTNLHDWMPISTNVAPSDGTPILIQVPTTSTPWRYFRAGQ